MGKRPCYVFTVTKARPDFIGLLKDETDTELTIERPFIVEYDNYVPVYSTDFMPLGKAPNYEDKFYAKVQKCESLYTVYMDDSHEMVKGYLAKVAEALKKPEDVADEALEEASLVEEPIDPNVN